MHKHNIKPIKSNQKSTCTTVNKYCSNMYDGIKSTHIFCVVGLQLRLKKTISRGKIPLISFMLPMPHTIRITIHFKTKNVYLFHLNRQFSSTLPKENIFSRPYNPYNKYNINIFYFFLV